MKGNRAGVNSLCGLGWPPALLSRAVADSGSLWESWSLRRCRWADGGSCHQRSVLEAPLPAPGEVMKAGPGRSKRLGLEPGRVLGLDAPLVPGSECAHGMGRGLCPEEAGAWGLSLVGVRWL